MIFGVNVPYLGGDYGHDLAENGRFPTWPCKFDPMRAYRPLIEAKRLGFRAVRIWLCENGEGIRVREDGAIESVSEKLLESVRVIQEAAALHGLYVYWNILDANAWPRENDPITRSILADADQSERFAEKIVREIAKVIDPALTIGIDLVNEPETATAECIGARAIDPIAWESIGRAIRIASHAARAEHASLSITSGTTHVFLPQLWRSGAELRAIDVHVYHTDGGLPSREDLARYVGDDAILDRSIPIIGGELGIPKDPGPALPASLANYLHNAERLEYAAAFLWQLEGDLIDKTSDVRSITWLGRRIEQTIRSIPHS